MIKLRDLYTELLDPKGVESYELTGPSVSSHDFSDGSVAKYYTWWFKNLKGQKMDITISYESEIGGMRPRITLSFGKKTSNIDNKYKSMTGARDLNTIFSSILKAAQEVIDKEIPKGMKGLYAIGFQPADDRRERIYDYFINKEFPQFKLDQNPKDREFKWYINQNYIGDNS